MNFIDRLTKSLRASTGDIVFGMEDGTVSVFGLVFGVALSANNSQVVLLAGATGAAAAAVSMMAGSYLDAATQQDQARALGRRTKAQREAEDAALAQRIAARLQAAGVPSEQADAFRGTIASTPGALAAIRAEIVPQNPMAEASPMAHALWMFISDLFAGPYRSCLSHCCRSRRRASYQSSLPPRFCWRSAWDAGWWPGATCCAPRSRQCSSPPQRPPPAWGSAGWFPRFGALVKL